jgi:D-alanyl-D-alanine carboxypeptidase (penicillin-binding protein 5/6)
MLKSIIVASANDASIAMAEKISGTHEAFVKKMNERAAELGMKNTNFVNCTGLPAENHYSTAYDVSLMSRELLKHSLFFKWSTIWLDYLKESENNTQLANTNRLVRFYDGCDGIKTGSTSEALYCLSATAKRGNLRLISVILAAPTSNVRFAESTKLLDYGFANYDSVPIIKKDQVVEKEIAIAGGKERIIEGIAAQDFSILQGKEESKSFEIKTEIQSNIKAPIAKGQKIGTLTIEKDGKVVGTIDILPDREVKSANIYDYFKDIINQWIQKLE